jgi:predicted TIM-barrel fold metal-dependent hydrolase
VLYSASRVIAHLPPPTRADVHQHLWTAPLLDALAARERLPFVRRTRELTVLHCAGEQAWAIDVHGETPHQRADLVPADGLDLALVALSSPVGIEALPRDEALELIDAHLDGITALPKQFAPWGPIALDRPDPDGVDDLLAHGCVGVSLPAGALVDPNAFDHIAPVLERASHHQAPVFVHPGPAPGPKPPQPSLNQPLWWAALTGYVAEMQAAWLTFATVGRREHPGLRILFAMLAGGAPLLSERLASRGGPPIDVRDPRTFYDTSSYGPVAIAAMGDRVGNGQLVYGSDRPVIEPISAASFDTTLKANAARFLNATSTTPATVAA